MEIVFTRYYLGKLYELNDSIFYPTLTFVS